MVSVVLSSLGCINTSHALLDLEGGDAVCMCFSKALGHRSDLLKLSLGG